MHIAQRLFRLCILIVLVSFMGGTTVALANYVLPALNSSTALTGYISGALYSPNGLATNRPFTISAIGQLQNGVVISVTTVNRQSPNYVFSPLLVGDLAVGYGRVGYGDNGMPVTYTVSAQTPGACYNVAPVHIVPLTSLDNIAANRNFTATYRGAAASITMLLTEVVGFGAHAPVSPVIVPPASAAAANNLFDVQFKLTRSDGAVMTSPVLSSNQPYTFNDLLLDEPLNGTCAWTYTATVVSIRPFNNAVPWKVVPAQGVTVVAGPDATAVSAPFVAYRYTVFTPFIYKP